MAIGKFGLAWIGLRGPKTIDEALELARENGDLKRATEAGDVAKLAHDLLTRGKFTPFDYKTKPFVRGTGLRPELIAAINQMHTSLTGKQPAAAIAAQAVSVYLAPRRDAEIRLAAHRSPAASKATRKP